MCEYKCNQMTTATSVKEDFERRVGVIPRLGLGLSVDVYSPDLITLLAKLEVRGLRIGYLEIFKATTTALEAVQRYCSAIPLTYHGEGLWITQPDFTETPIFQAELAETVRQLATICSPWLNHECAAKQVAGYSFGTYLPPLYTEPSARVVAANVALVQEKLDLMSRGLETTGPLFLLEMPPLTYFSAGTIPIPAYFRLVTQQVACGLVLDIGHLWTVYRYTAARKERSLEDFVQEFLDVFPMERVVEIHVAGLARHEADSEGSGTEILPAWIDAHAAPIPPVLLTILEQVLAHPGLLNLRGVALEVDTKSIETIVEEFHEVNQRFSGLIERRMSAHESATTSARRPPPATADRPAPTQEERIRLRKDYVRYAQIVSGKIEPEGTAWRDAIEDRVNLARYATHYLPYEILHWGGELTDMFPGTCRMLAQAELSLDHFVDWWVGTSRPGSTPYDFFLLKIDRFLEFVTLHAPACLVQAEREADLLRSGYADANQGVRPAMEPTR